MSTEVAACRLGDLMSIANNLSLAGLVESTPRSRCLTSPSRQTRESWSTFTSCSTASNIRGPGRTVGKIISLLGRNLDKVVDSMPESLDAVSEALFSSHPVKAKVLLVGSADSGKSDIIKHLRSMYNSKGPLAELASLRKLVYDHIRHEMMLLLKTLERGGGFVSEDNVSNARHVENADEIYHGEPFPTTLYAALSSLCDDPGIQATWEQSHQPDLPYFYSSLDRFFSFNYVPTYEDIVQVLSAKGEMPETTFSVPGVEITFVDAGLCKEPPNLSDITCILYVVNLAGYDKILCRDRRAIQMDRNRASWSSICQSRWYQETPLLLIFNNFNSPSLQFEDFSAEVSSPNSNRAPDDDFTEILCMRKHFIKIAKRHHGSNLRNFVHIAKSSVHSSWRFVLCKTSLLRRP